MNCDQARRLLSYEPKGTLVPYNPAVRCHLDRCPACRSFWLALMRIDRALAARPLTAPMEGFVRGVMGQVSCHPRRQIAPPFSRAFCLFSSTLILCALVGGAWLLHYWSSTSALGTSGLPALWLAPAWPSDASVWLSLQGEHVAQIVLAVMAGVLVTLASAAAGLHASARLPHDGRTSPKRPSPPCP